MKTDGIIEVALAADQNYIVGLTVAAYSIACCCDQECSLRFHILYMGFSDRDKTTIRNLLCSVNGNCEVCFYDISEIDLSEFPVYAASRMTYARLFLPKLLINVKYVIYTDVDTLWLDDISDLWNLRNHVKMVSCVREQSEKTKDMEESWFVSNGMEFDRDKYFCAGVSFYNLFAIRNSNAFDKVIEFGARHRGFNCADQSMLYGAIGGQVEFLPDRWQTLPRNGVTACPGEPVVLHYAGEVPWRCTHYTRMITDTQLLWFQACAIARDESLWCSLRRFYSAPKIIFSRVVFILLFKIWPVSVLSRGLLKMAGIKSFRETLYRRRHYLRPLIERKSYGIKAASSAAAI